MNNYRNSGILVTWTNGTGSAVVAGQVVAVGQVLGVAAVDIASTATGTVQIGGRFTVPKVSGAVIAQGESLSWDASAGAFDDNAAVAAEGDVYGAPAIAAEAAGDGVTSFDVIFTGVPGTVEPAAG